MKKMNRILVATMMALTMLGGTVVPSVTASAAKKTGYSRTFKTPLAHDKYKVKNKNGRTFKMTGKAKNIKLRTNHYLKNYKKTKWIRTNSTLIKHKGNWILYYYMKPITKKKHAGGWVKLTDMKPVKSHKASKYVLADFDTWYRGLSKKQRNQYYDLVRDGDNTNAEHELEAYPYSYFR